MYLPRLNGHTTKASVDISFISIRERHGNARWCIELKLCFKKIILEISDNSREIFSSLVMFLPLGYNTIQI